LKNFIKLFLLILIGLNFSSCKQTVELTDEEKFEEAKYNVYEKFIGEYTADSYLDFSEDYSVPFLGSKYERMESIIFKKDSVVFNGKTFPIKLYCTCELEDNHILKSDMFSYGVFSLDGRLNRFYDYDYEEKFGYKYDNQEYDSWQELAKNFTKWNEKYPITIIETMEKKAVGYPIIKCHYDCCMDLIIGLDESTYIKLSSYDGIKLYFKIGLYQFETYQFEQEWDNRAVRDDVRVYVSENEYYLDRDWIAEREVFHGSYDGLQTIDEASKENLELYSYYEASFYKVEKEDDNNSENPDDDSTNDDENESGTENDTTLDFSLEGDWLYSIQGFQPTTLTLYNDQTFEFNKNNDITSGTYSLSGNKITFDFEKGGQEITDMFIISGSENEITLNLVKSITTYDGSTQESTTMSYMLLAFYTTMETSITLTK